MFDAKDFSAKCGVTRRLTSLYTPAAASLRRMGSLNAGRKVSISQAIKNFWHGVRQMASFDLSIVHLLHIFSQVRRTARKCQGICTAQIAASHSLAFVQITGWAGPVMMERFGVDLVVAGPGWTETALPSATNVPWQKHPCTPLRGPRRLVQSAVAHEAKPVSSLRRSNFRCDYRA